jgi:hypothetical protein
MKEINNGDFEVICEERNERYQNRMKPRKTDRK